MGWNWFLNLFIYLEWKLIKEQKLCCSSTKLGQLLACWVVNLVPLACVCGRRIGQQLNMAAWLALMTGHKIMQMKETTIWGCKVPKKRLNISVCHADVVRSSLHFILSFLMIPLPLQHICRLPAVMKNHTQMTHIFLKEESLRGIYFISFVWKIVFPRLFSSPRGLPDSHTEFFYFFVNARAGFLHFHYASVADNFKEVHWQAVSFIYYLKTYRRKWGNKMFHREMVKWALHQKYCPVILAIFHLLTKALCSGTSRL